MLMRGVLMCSRNARLSPQARQDALCISRGLKWAEAAVADGTVTDPAAIKDHIAGLITGAGGKVDYVEVRAAEVG